jgi:hypothetical protein
MIEEAMRAPVSVGMLKIDGARIMEIGKRAPGREIGWVLHALFEEVLDEPERNVVEHLERRTLELLALSEEELARLGEGGKERRSEKEEEEVGAIRKKYGVK